MIYFSLLIPGIIALVYAILQGPASWTLGAHTFWGTPIVLFVFWIGISHAGTLLSAIFLALGIKLEKKIALLAELSTIISLITAAIFPLVHLGVIENFYMLVPFLDNRELFSNVRSPLVWDFCAILIYGFLSIMFFATHFLSLKNPAIEKFQRPLAWLIFPLVISVHTIVSLDFAVTFIPEWRGAFFPIYFVVGAIYSGFALVNFLLIFEKKRNILLEKLMLASGGVLVLIWLWNFLLKGDFSLRAFIFASLFPLLYFVKKLRHHPFVRAFIYISILVGLFFERLDLVIPKLENLKFIDWGLIYFSISLFFVLYLFLKKKFVKNVPENAENFRSMDFKILQIPLLFGILIFVLFVIMGFHFLTRFDVQIEVLHFMPLAIPIIVFAAASFIFVKYILRFLQEKYKRGIAICFVLAFAFLGALHAGFSNEFTPAKQAEILPSEEFQIHDIWKNTCAACHGETGDFNEKFIREYYPLPQKLTLSRLDSLGEDSLYQVVLKGRVNMSAYENRLTPNEIRALLHYMRGLAK